MSQNVVPTAAPEASKPNTITLASLPTLTQRLKAAIKSLRWSLQPLEQALLTRAQGYGDLATDDDLQSAGLDLVAVKRVRRSGEAYYAELKRPFNLIRQDILDYEKLDVNPWVRVESQLERKIIECKREKQRLDEERQREEQRIADLRAAEEHEQQVQALAHVAEQQTDPIVREALEIEAAALAESPVRTTHVPVESSIPHLPNLGFTTRYKVEIRGDVALMTLLRAIAAKKPTVPLRAAIGICCAKDDEGRERPGVYTSPFLNDQAKAHDGELHYPGCTVVTVEGTTGR